MYIYIKKVMNSTEVKQKIRKIILESMEPETSFVTPIQDSSVRFYDFLKSNLAAKYNFAGAEDFEAKSSLKVYWSLIIHSDQISVKSLDVVVKKIAGVIHVTPHPDQSDQVIEVPFDSSDLGFEINNELVVKNGAAIIPVSLEISFERKEINVE